VPLHVLLASPSDLVLFVLRYQPNTLEDIGDVIYPSLLHSELSDRIVQVDTLLWGFFDQLNKLLGQLHQSVLLSGSLA